MIQCNVNPNETAVVTCPDCDTHRTITVAGFKGNRHVLKLRCSCGHVFTVQLNFRRYFRKEVDLPGVCHPIKDPGHKVPVKIKNLSLFGVGMELLGTLTVKEGDRLLIEFTLDDKKQTPMSKNAQVVQADGAYVGCSFILAPGEIDKALGFYLRF